MTANYKETQLTDVRPGQPITIGVGHLPRRRRAWPMSTASPRPPARSSTCCRPDNATGNFTKIVQRIPVKIDIPDPHDLLAGMYAGHIGRTND